MPTGTVNTRGDPSSDPDSRAAEHRHATTEAEVQTACWWVKTAIARWSHRIDEPPPFSCDELVVIALLLQRRPMSAFDIYCWTCETFGFYRKIGSPAAWRYLNDSPSAEERDEDEDAVCADRFSGFTRALRAWHVPVVQLPGSREDRLGGLQSDATKWEVEPGEAMLYLRPRLWPDHMRRRGAFPFLRLPPELGNTVYEMVFALPPSGVQINEHDLDRSGTLYAASRSYDQPFDFDLWMKNKTTDTLIVGRLATHLSLLRVNRRIRHEALYTFAAANTFYFTSAAHALHILNRRMSVAQRDNIREVAFTHVPGIPEGSDVVRCFEVFAVMSRLRRVRIWVDQARWREYYWYRPYRDRRPVELMGFNLTPRIREGVEVELAGDCPSEVLELIRSDPVVPSRWQKAFLHDGATRVGARSRTEPSVGEFFFYCGWPAIALAALILCLNYLGYQLPRDNKPCTRYHMTVLSFPRCTEVTDDQAKALDWFALWGLTAGVMFMARCVQWGSARDREAREAY